MKYIISCCVCNITSTGNFGNIQSEIATLFRLFTRLLFQCIHGFVHSMLQVMHLSQQQPNKYDLQHKGSIRVSRTFIRPTRSSALPGTGYVYIPSKRLRCQCRQVSPLFYMPRRPLGRVELQLYSFQDLGALDGSGGVSPTPRPPLHSGKTRYPFYRKLGGLRDRSGWAENLVPTGIRWMLVQRRVNH